RITMMNDPGSGKSITKLISLMQDAGLLDRFVTLEAAVLDPAKHEVSFVNAGHNPPLICHRDGTVAEAFSHTLGGFPLGVLEGYEYEVCATITLAPGDSVVMF